jgi:hypothetical protein
MVAEVMESRRMPSNPLGREGGCMGFCRIGIKGFVIKILEVVIGDRVPGGGDPISTDRISTSGG